MDFSHLVFCIYQYDKLYSSNALLIILRITLILNTVEVGGALKHVSIARRHVSY